MNTLLQAVALPSNATFYEFLRSCNTADDKDYDLSTYRCYFCVVVMAPYVFILEVTIC